MWIFQDCLMLKTITYDLTRKIVGIFSNRNFGSSKLNLPSILNVYSFGWFLMLFNPLLCFWVALITVCVHHSITYEAWKMVYLLCNGLPGLTCVSCLQGRTVSIWQGSERESSKEWICTGACSVHHLRWHSMRHDFFLSGGSTNV